MEMKKIISVTFVFVSLVLVLISTTAYAELTPPLPSAPTYEISVEKAHAMLEKKPEHFILLDVRTEEEYNAEKIDIEGVVLINIPVSDLESRLDELDNSKSFIVYSNSGGRSSAANDTLVQHNFIVYNMLGGITAWKAKYDTSTSTTTTDAETTSPAVSPAHIAPTESPVTSPVTTPTQGAEKEVPGFEVIIALAAISLIAWRRVLRKQ